MPIDIDPATRLILDFIAGGVPDNPEGESKGNYNAYFGHADSKTDLSVKSLGQIYLFQNGMLRNNPRSSAVGKYQFLKATLQDLQTQQSLPDSELFTPALQDELGWRLLIRRGYREWWQGTMDDDTFLNGIAKEWASMPSPETGGKSYYANQSASTTLEKARRMLASARKLIPVTAPAPAPNPSPVASLTAEETAALDAIRHAYELCQIVPGLTDVEKNDISRNIQSLQNQILAAVAIRLTQCIGLL